jgi:hypothetical protein
MDFTKLRGGEDLEVGALRAYRFWRYRFEPMVRLYSFVSEKHWPSGEAVEGGPVGPDVGEQGIHAFKTKRMLLNAVGKRFDGLIKRAGFTHPPSHGIVVGSVEMWGILWEHALGYRAQYARPLSFISAHGYKPHEALARLRSDFDVAKKACG